MQILGTRPQDLYLGTRDRAETAQHSLGKMGKERLHSVKWKYQEMQFRAVHLYIPEQAFLLAQMVKNPPRMQETSVQLLGWEDPLKKGIAAHSSILAWRILWTEESGKIQPTGSQRDTTERITLSLSFHGPRAGRWGQNPRTKGSLEVLTPFSESTGKNKNMGKDTQKC